MKASALIAALALSLGGCAATSGSLTGIQGVAPDDGSCRVDVLNRDNGSVLSSTPVRGNFSIGFGLGDDYQRKVDLAGVCNGKRVVFFQGVVPGVIGTTNLGTLKP